MKNLKRITSLLLAAAYFAGNINAAETIHLKYGDDNYAVTPLWINMKAVEDYYMQKIDDSTWGHSPFFFARNGVIYFTKDAGIAPSTSLLAVDGLTGEFKEIMPIDWNSFTHNEVAAVYCGVDSDGTCYVASYGTASSDRYPFHIFPLEFDESGHPKVIGRYQLEFGGNDWWIKSIDVCGSLLSGDFTVASCVWNSMTIDSTRNLRTSVCLWHYSQYQPVWRREYVQPLTVPDIRLLTEDRLIVHDRHFLENTTGYDYGTEAIAREPSLYTIDGDNMIFHSAIGAQPEDDGLGNGAAVFSLGEDHHFMAYASSGCPSEFKLAAVPSSPSSFDDSEVLCVLTPKSIGLTDVEPGHDRFRTNVCTEKVDDNTVRVYVGGMRGVAAYSISRPEDLNTGIDEVTIENDMPTEYYTLTGLRISNPPSTGLYIEKKGAEVSKKIAR